MSTITSSVLENALFLSQKEFGIVTWVHVEFMPFFHTVQGVVSVIQCSLDVYSGENHVIPKK